MTSQYKRRLDVPEEVDGRKDASSGRHVDGADLDLRVAERHPRLDLPSTLPRRRRQLLDGASVASSGSTRGGVFEVAVGCGRRSRRRGRG